MISFEDLEAAASDLAGDGMTLGERNEVAVLEWIPIDSRLCPEKQRSDRHNLFVVSTYTLVDCSSEEFKGTLHQNRHDLVRTTRRGDIVILAGDTNVRLSRLS